MYVCLCNKDVVSGGATTVNYWIIPRKVGTITLEIHGQSADAYDAIKKDIIVEV